MSVVQALIRLPLILATVVLYRETLTPRNRPLPTVSQPKPAIADDTSSQKGAIETIVFFNIPLQTKIQRVRSNQDSSYHNSHGLQVLVTMTGIAECLLVLAATFSNKLGNSTSIISTLTSLLVFILGAGSIISGCLLRKWCFHEMGKMFTFDVRILDKHELVKGGPYSFARCVVTLSLL